MTDGNPPGAVVTVPSNDTSKRCNNSNHYLPFFLIALALPIILRLPTIQGIALTTHAVPFAAHQTTIVTLLLAPLMRSSPHQVELMEGQMIPPLTFWDPTSVTASSPFGCWDIK